MQFLCGVVLLSCNGMHMPYLSRVLAKGHTFMCALLIQHLHTCGYSGPETVDLWSTKGPQTCSAAGAMLCTRDPRLGL